MAIDWNAPLEAVHRNGIILPVELDEDQAGCRPDEYVIVDNLDSGCGYGPSVFLADGSAWIADDLDWSAWTIRNRE
jgi:hypothetical protein